MRAKIQIFVESPKFQNVIIGLILVNAVILGLETSNSLMSSIGIWLKILDNIILNIFIFEIVLRIMAYGWRFFTRPWSLFDLAIVMIALIPASGAFSALRALRVLRVLRLISVAPSMRKVVEGLLTAIPGIASVATIVLLIFYVFAVIGTHLYADTFPQWFGSLGATMFTLFQIMTLESWANGIVRNVMDVHPSAWAFFVTYILMTTFTMLNLFIAVIVNAMHTDEIADAKDDREAMKKALSDEMKAMEQRLLEQIRKT